MSVFKRNAVIVTVLVFVCAAVYLNWSYSQTEAGLPLADTGESESAATLDMSSDTETAGLYYTDASSDGETAVTTAAGEYFDQVRLSRERARDSAKTTLTSVTEAANADSETVNDALEAMVQMAKRTEEEARLESLIIAKGFEDCVAYMTDDAVTVTVSAGSEGLSGVGAARIKDIILTETDYNANQMKIIEIK